MLAMFFDKVVSLTKKVFLFLGFNSSVPLNNFLSDKEIDDLLKERLRVECESLVKLFPHVFNDSTDVLFRYKNIIQSIGENRRPRGRPKGSLTSGKRENKISVVDPVSSDLTGTVNSILNDVGLHVENNRKKNNINKINSVKSFPKKENLLRVKKIE